MYKLRNLLLVGLVLAAFTVSAQEKKEEEKEKTDGQQNADQVLHPAGSFGIFFGSSHRLGERGSAGSPSDRIMAFASLNLS